MEQKDPQEEAKEICRDALKKLAWINLRLSQLVDLIKESQPKTKGSITLSLYRCGRGCMACSHLKWRIWGVRKGKGGGDALFLAHDMDKSPLIYMKKPKKGFEEDHEKVKGLMKEALALERERSDIVAALSALKRSFRFKV